MFMIVSSSIAQDAIPNPKQPRQQSKSNDGVSAFNEQELYNALLKILDAAPSNFEDLHQGNSSNNDFLQVGLSFEGTVQLSTCNKKPQIAEQPDHSWYYNLYLAVNLEKDEIKINADAAEPILLRALGKGAKVADRLNESGIVTINIKTPKRKEWIQMNVAPWGSITLFVFNTPM